MYSGVQAPPAKRQRDKWGGSPPQKRSKKASIAHTNLPFIGYMILFSVVVSVIVRYTTGYGSTQLSNVVPANIQGDTVAVYPLLYLCGQE